MAKLTMKRIDPSEAPSQPQTQDRSEIRQKAAQNVRPVQAFGGTFVVAGDDPESTPETSSALHQVTTPVRNNGVVSAIAPEQGEQEMEEVSYEEWAESQKSDLSEGKLSPTQLVKELVGKSVATAENLLGLMKQRGEITEYRVVPIGAPMSMEVQPGRVQVLSDHAGNVVDVEIS